MTFHFFVFFPLSPSLSLSALHLSAFPVRFLSLAAVRVHIKFIFKCSIIHFTLNGGAYMVCLCERGSECVVGLAFAQNYSLPTVIDVDVRWVECMEWKLFDDYFCEFVCGWVQSLSLSRTDLGAWHGVPPIIQAGCNGSRACAYIKHIAGKVSVERSFELYNYNAINGETSRVSSNELHLWIVWPGADGEEGAMCRARSI